MAATLFAPNCSTAYRSDEVTSSDVGALLKTYGATGRSTLSLPLAQACGAACEGVVFGGHKCRAPELLEMSDPLKKHCDDYIAAFQQKFPNEPFALFSIYGHDAVRTYAEAAGRVIKDGKELTRDSLVKAMETFDGQGFLTSHGYIETGEDNHRLTGTWKEAYLNLTVEVDGTAVKWVLAPKAEASGAEA